MEIQRGRMLAAVVDAVAEVGYAQLTVSQIISRSRISRKTFYDEFADREDCFLCAFEQAIDQARLVASEAYKRESVWREGIRAALTRLLALIEEEPRLARLFFVEALAAGDAVLRRRTELIDEIASVVDRGRDEAGAAREPPPLAAESVIGGVFAVIHARMLKRHDERFVDLAGPLMSLVVLPYMGVRAANIEASRAGPATPVKARAREATDDDPFSGLKMRVTYRTVRVLMSVSEVPGASNRQIAEASDVSDEGQISKLLARLEGLGLLENHGEGQIRGAPNAWYLTPRGEQLERSTRPRERPR